MAWFWETRLTHLSKQMPWIVANFADKEIARDQGEGTTVTITFPELVPVDEAKDARLPVEWV